VIENGILVFPLITRVEIGLEENTVCTHTLQVTNQVALGVEIVATSVPLLRMIKVTEGGVY
jgi:hypothetical protein